MGTQARRECEPIRLGPRPRDQKESWGVGQHSRPTGTSSWVEPCGLGQMWAGKFAELLAALCLQGREKKSKLMGQTS